jgi:hypothetical protein
MRGKILHVVFTGILTFAHLLYAWWMSLVLYQCAGGIRKLPNGWTGFGGASYAWTIPLQIPGALLARLGEHIFGPQNPGIFGPLSLLAIFAASMVTAYAITSLIVAAFRGDRPICGRHYWRVVVILLGMLWIPVREDWAEVYQYTVVY